MLCQVVIGTVCNAPEFAPAEREGEFDIGGCFGIEGEFFRIMIAESHFLIFDAKVFQPLYAETSPVFKPFQVGIRLAEEFQLHLLKLTGTECEITRCDLITEGFAYLADAERHFLSGCSLYVLEVDKNALCGLRTKVDHVFCIFRNTLEGLEHQVEMADRGEIALAAGRARNLVVRDELLHLLIAPAVDGSVQCDPVCQCIVFDNLVCTKSFMALSAVHQRI